jgi:hypothetical protein
MFIANPCMCIRHFCAIRTQILVRSGVISEVSVTPT